MAIGAFSKDFIEVNPGPAIENKTAELFVNEGERLRKEIELQSTKAEAAVLGPILATSYTDAFQKLAKGDTEGFKDLSVAMTHASTNPFLASMSKEIGNLADTAYKSYMDQTLQTERLKNAKELEAIQQAGAMSRTRINEAGQTERSIRTEESANTRLNFQENKEDDRSYQRRLEFYEREQKQLFMAYTRDHNAWAKNESDRQGIITKFPQLKDKYSQPRPEPKKSDYGIDEDGSQRPKPPMSTGGPEVTGVPDYVPNAGGGGNIAGPTPVTSLTPDLPQGPEPKTAPVEGVPNPDNLPVNIAPDATNPIANAREVTTPQIAVPPASESYPQVSGVALPEPVAPAPASPAPAEAAAITPPPAAAPELPRGMATPQRAAQAASMAGLPAPAQVAMASQGVPKGLADQETMKFLKDNFEEMPVGNTNARIYIMNPETQPNTTTTVTLDGITSNITDVGNKKEVDQLEKDRQTVQAGLSINDDFVNWMGRMGELGYDVTLDKKSGGKEYSAHATNPKTGEKQYWTDAQTVKDKDGKIEFYHAWSEKGLQKTITEKEAEKHFAAKRSMDLLVKNHKAVTFGYGSQDMTKTEAQLAEQASQEQLQTLFKLPATDPNKDALIKKENAYRSSRGWTPVENEKQITLKPDERHKTEMDEALKQAGFNPKAKGFWQILRSGVGDVKRNIDIFTYSRGIKLQEADLPRLQQNIDDLKEKQKTTKKGGFDEAILNSDAKWAIHVKKLAEEDLEKHKAHLKQLIQDAAYRKQQDEEAEK